MTPSDPEPGRPGDPSPAAGERGGSAQLSGALRPAVAARASAPGLLMIVGGAVLLGVLVLLVLVMRRSQGDHELRAANSSTAEIAAPPLPPDMALVEAAGRSTNLAVVPPVPPVIPPPPPSAPLVVGAPPVATGPSPAELTQRRHAPSLVVDLAEGSGSSAAAANGEAISTGPGKRADGPIGSRIGPQLSGDEQFADRVGSAETDNARATSLRNPGSVVPQGTMIPAVLETAMNSDLPGYVRAVVSRDVRGFDGASVLIPRGSRLVGQYRSGLTQGASRIFVIWTRVLRPDGASVQIASPGGDPLGRAGQEGKVHSHFFRQFASSILLSVINAEVSNLAAQPSTQIIIGGAATGITSSAAPYAGAQGTTAGTPGGTGGATAFPPTITVLQGAPISIFVARDLDFSSVRALAK